jgi:GalNAc-alpha-(1->4)-GalNAc-alpha-(1->3)-diNAcBac-PP-undecaprenol alpha-1,4-N-acetyl-D-galactosaminyltransferase
MILFVMLCMKAGGAERVTAYQANYWAERGHKVGIIVYDKTPSHFPLHPNVELFTNDLARVSKNKMETVFNKLRQAFILRGWFRRLRPTSVIAVMEEVNMVSCLASIGLPHHLVLYDVANPAYYGKSLFRQWIKQMSYRLADVLIVQTEGVKTVYKGFKLPIAVIKNPLPTPPKVQIDYANRVVVSVGRLDNLKNLALVIKAFARVNAPNWELRIFGTGEEERNLQQLITDLGVENRVFLKGLTQNVYAELAQASIFAFGSKIEGYPNVLLEGMSAGLAVVSTDCPFGPAEIIAHEKNGLLVPNNDEKAFATALQRLIDDGNFREKLGKEAVKIAEELKIERIMDEWEKHVFL